MVGVQALPDRERAHGSAARPRSRSSCCSTASTGSRPTNSLALAQEANRKGWWEAYSDALPDAHSGYIGLEAEATASCHWAPEFVTGLVQTEDYARELISEPRTGHRPHSPR